MPPLNAPELVALYREEEARRGSDQPFVMTPSNHGFVHVTHGPGRDWQRILPHAMHEASTYASWQTDEQRSSVTTYASSPEELRARGMYRVVTPDERVELGEPRAVRPEVLCPGYGRGLKTLGRRAPPLPALPSARARRGGPMATTTIYSCDDHLDIWNLPPDLWETHLPPSLRERGPRVVDKDGRTLWVADGKVLGPSGGLAGFSAIERAGIDDDAYRPSDPARRLLDMDLDGITASVIYGPMALASMRIADPELLEAVHRAFNDWAAEFNRYAPDRLALLPALPGNTPEAAVAELERVAGLGHRGALISVFDIDCGAPEWEPLWAAAAATGLPLSFHLRGGTSRLQWADDSWKAPAYATVLPMQLDEPLVAMVFSGALERNPGFKLVLAESGIGWIPYIVHRMDLEFHKHGATAADYRLQSLPSEIFRSQMWATFEEEPDASELIPLLGADRFMWASDYPHPDSTFPNSAKAIEEALGRLTPEDRHQVVAANCAALYGFA